MKIQPRTILFLAPGLVLTLVALLVVWAPAGSDSAQADTSAPEMHFVVSGTGVTCDAGATDGDPWDGTTAPKCTVPSGGGLTITVQGDDGASPNAAFGMATIIDLDGLNLNPGAEPCSDPEGFVCPASAQINYMPCGIAAAAVDPAGNVGYSCSQFFSAVWANEPAVLTIDGLECKADGAHKVVLGAERPGEPNSPTGGAKFFNDSAGPNATDPIALKVSGSQTWHQPSGANIDIPVADVVTINCGEVAGETPTATATATSEGPTATATATSDGPTATATATSEGPTNTPVPPTNTPVPPTATNTPSDVEKGDVNGDGVVNSIDALWVLWLVADITQSVPVPEASDVDNDGDVDALDALYILWIELDLV